MKKKNLLFILLCTLILFQTSMGLAMGVKLPEPSYSFYVYDETNIIQRQVEDYIIDTNKALYKKTGAQVVVASINSLADIDVKEFGNKLFEKWNIGSKEYDNGLLILIVPEERQIWIEVGYGLEGALPDSKVGNIIKNSILPYFKEDNYSEGILSGFNEIINEIEKEYNIELEREKIDGDLYDFGNSYDDSDIFSSMGKILVIFGIIIFLFIDFKLFNGAITYSILRGSRYGGGSSYRGGSSGGGGRSGGGGAGGKW
jgi:uncharacterized protein